MSILFLFRFIAAVLMPSPPYSDLETLKALNARFIHNFVTNDTVSHSPIIHSGFVYIASSGQCITRQEYLAQWLHGFDGLVYWDYRDERIQVFGTTALVRAANKFVRRNGEQETTGMVRYTDVYVKENGVWQCVQAQITTLEPGCYPPDSTIVKQYDFRSQRR